MYEKILYLIILLLGIPTGIYLAWLCKDEIKAWRFRMILISILSFAIAIVLFFINFQYKIPVILSLFFIIITCLTIVWKVI
jgi:hypothetical protein